VSRDPLDANNLLLRCGMTAHRGRIRLGPRVASGVSGGVLAGRLELLA